MMSKTLIIPPAQEPVSLEEAKAQLRVDGLDDDAYIVNLIKAARQHTENVTWRALITQTWDVYFDRFSSEIEIPLGQLQSVVSISYVDTDGITQTVDSSIYDVDTDSDPGKISLSHGQSWPMIRPQRNAVTIRFVAGYGNQSSVPFTIKQAILFLVGHFYENRESSSMMTVKEVPLSFQSLIDCYQLKTF